MWFINIIVIKLKIILMLIIKLKNKSTFNTLKLVYGFFLGADKDKKLSIIPCFHPLQHLALIQNILVLPTFVMFS
jgi:hypothetical protein